MKTRRQERLKMMLLEKKRKLWTELREEVFKKLGKEYHEQFDNPEDIEGQAIIDLIEDTGLAEADIRQAELTKMDEAVRKLEDGTYGICEECGSEIDEERLNAISFASRCIECQSKKEGKKPTL